MGMLTPHDSCLGGTVCRIVDFGPNTQPVMHRTQSLDYGVVLEGEVEMQLDSGESRILKRGDVAVQRGTNHAWKNVTKVGGRGHGSEGGGQDHGTEERANGA